MAHPVGIQKPTCTRDLAAIRTNNLHPWPVSGNWLQLQVLHQLCVWNIIIYAGLSEQFLNGTSAQYRLFSAIP